MSVSPLHLQGDPSHRREQPRAVHREVKGKRGGPPPVHVGEDVLHPRHGKPQTLVQQLHQLVGIPGGRQPVEGPRRGVSVIADGIARGALDNQQDPHARRSL